MACTVEIIKGLEAKVERLSMELAQGRFRAEGCGYCSNSGVLMLGRIEDLQAVIAAQGAIIGWYDAHVQYTPKQAALEALKHALKVAKAEAGDP